MTEQIVTKEVAALAKEKGFDIITGDYYSGDEIITGWSRSGIPACTQSLLQKWLRDKYNIHLNLIKSYKNWMCDIYEINEYGLGNHLVNPQTIFGTTYEQALEEGLKQALKLINNNDILQNN